MTQQVTPEQVLDAAAEYIHEHGWTRGTNQDAVGRVCLQGAIAKAVIPWASTASSPELVEAWQALRRSLLARYFIPSFDSTIFDPTYWNDQICRDADEAVEALKLAKEYL